MIPKFIRSYYGKCTAKKIMVFFLLMLFVPLSFAAAPYDKNLGWHRLQQIMSNESLETYKSLDENLNSVVDRADTVGSLDGDASLGDGTTNAVFKVKGATTLWSAIDFYSGSSTAIWGLGRNQNDNKFYIDRSGVGRVLTIDPLSLNVGIGSSAPTQKLDVVGYVKGTGLCIGTACITSWPTGISGGSPNYIPKWNNATGLGNSVIYDNGNVGISTSSPTRKLDVSGRLLVREGSFPNGWDTADWGATVSLRQPGAPSMASATHGNAQLEIVSSGRNTPHIAFHAPGYYGANFGLDTDNMFSTQGWSSGGGYTGLKVGTTNMFGHLTVGIPQYTYITMRDDESPNGIKHIHANSNVVGFLSGQGGWISYWDNSGNMYNAGAISAGGTVSVGGSLCVQGWCYNPMYSNVGEDYYGSSTFGWIGYDSCNGDVSGNFGCDPSHNHACYDTYFDWNEYYYWYRYVDCNLRTVLTSNVVN